MILKELIERLEKEDPEKIVPLGFSYPHSYRGFYSDLAFEPIENISVGQMLECAKEALDSTYEGYKGGEYTMTEYSNVWIANYGSTGESIGHILLNYMLNLY